MDASGKKAAFAEVIWSQVDRVKVMKNLVRKVHEVPWDFEEKEYYVIAKELKGPCKNCITLESLMQVKRK